MSQIASTSIQKQENPAFRFWYSMDILDDHPNGKHYTLHSGEFFLISPNVTHLMVLAEDCTLYDRIIIHIDPDFYHD